MTIILRSRTIVAVKAANIGPYIWCLRLHVLSVQFLDNSLEVAPGMGSGVTVIFTVTVTVLWLTVEGIQDDGDNDIVFDGTLHDIVELSGVEYPGIMAKVEELEHRLEPILDGELGECITKHFAMRVGTTELPTCIRYFLMVSLFL